MTVSLSLARSIVSDGVDEMFVKIVCENFGLQQAQVGCIDVWTRLGHREFAGALRCAQCFEYFISCGL